MCLEKKAESSDAKFVCMAINLEGVKRSNKYVRVDRRIERATEDLEKQETWNDFRGMGH